MQFFVERAAYAVLNLAIPRFKAGPSPGRTESLSICDTGAQLVVIPMQLVHSMRIKPETLFPVQTEINGVSNAPITIQRGLFLNIQYTNSQGMKRHSRQLVICC